MNEKYSKCYHSWEFHIDADKSGFPEAKPWCSFFICKKCNIVINFLEKNALDQLAAQEKSLKIQETHTRIGMIANIISFLLLSVAVFTLLYGESILKNCPINVEQQIDSPR